MKTTEHEYGVPKIIHEERTPFGGEVFKDIRKAALDLEKVYIQDVDNDSNNEFAFVFKNSEEEHGSVYTYRLEKGDIVKVNIPNKFFNNFKDNSD